MLSRFGLYFTVLFIMFSASKEPSLCNDQLLSLFIAFCNMMKEVERNIRLNMSFQLLKAWVFGEVQVSTSSWEINHLVVFTSPLDAVGHLDTFLKILDFARRPPPGSKRLVC